MTTQLIAYRTFYEDGNVTTGICTDEFVHLRKCHDALFIDMTKRQKEVYLRLVAENKSRLINAILDGQTTIDILDAVGDKLDE